MDEKQFRELRTLILGQSVKIEALTMEVRALKQASGKTEIVYLGPDELGCKIDTPEDIKKLMGL